VARAVDGRTRRVCMVSTHGYFDPVPQLGRTDTGGQVVYVLQLARGLASRGVEVDIYTRWFDPERRQVESLPDCPAARVIRMQAGPWEFVRKEQIYRVLPELAANMIAFIEEQQLGYDLFHGHYVDGGIVALDVAKAFDKPAFFTAHSLGAWKREQMGGDPLEMEKAWNFKERIAEELRVFRLVRAQTVTTELQKERLERLYAFHSDNVVVIPPGVDIHTYRPLQPGDSRAGIDLPGRYVFCLSRIDSNKGHDLLLDAFDAVRKRVPDMHLVIGGGSPEPQGMELDVLQAIARVIRRRGMGDCVHVVGYVPDELVVPYYQHAQLFVLPSVFEPFGMTALEAMACGTPVVASELGGIRDVIRSGETGMLVDPRDRKGFAETMVRLLEDRDLATLIAARGRSFVEEGFSWEAIAARHIAFYDRFGVLPAL